MNDLPTAALIEALLFTRGEALEKKELTKALSVTPEALEEALTALRATLRGRGITLVDDGKEVELRSSPAAAHLLERLRKEEMSRDIGKAGLETLAIVLYKGPVTRSEIDFIRGVNSSHTLRVLLMRGLVRKITNPKDERSFLYEPTTELFGHLGIESKANLPEREAIEKELQALTATKDEDSHAAE